MIATLDETRYRLARYYLVRLRAADASYRRGQASSADSTALLNQDWAQIAQWQMWAAAHSTQNPEAARLCAAYPQAGAEVLITRQTPQERIAWLKAGVAAAQAAGDVRAEVVCLFRMAWAIHKQAALEHAEKAARAALARAEMLGDPLLIGQSVHLLGEIALRRGDFEQAEVLHLQSLTVLRAVDAQAALADVYFSLSENAYVRAEYVSARDYAQQCYQMHVALGLNPATNNNLTCLGMFTAEAGDLDAGEQYIRQSIALCRSSGAQSTLAHALKCLAGLMILRKAWTQARTYADESLRIAEAIGEEWLIPDILIFSGRIHSLTNDHAAAQRDTALAVEIARTTGYRLTLLEALIHLAEVQVAANKIEQARVALYEGLEAAVQTRIPLFMLYGVFVAAQWLKLANAPRAAELVGLLLRCPGTEYAVRNELPALCTELAARLGNAQFAAMAHIGTLELDVVAAAIVQELARAPRA